MQRLLRLPATVLLWLATLRHARASYQQGQWGRSVYETDARGQAWQQPTSATGVPPPRLLAGKGYNKERRLLVSGNPEWNVPSSDFVYREGAVMQQFAGFGSKPGEGISAITDGLPPNLTFFSAATDLTIDRRDGSMYLIDLDTHFLQKLTPGTPWNTSVLLDGTWVNATIGASEEDRVIEVSILTPTAIVHRGNNLYIADWDTGRIFRVDTRLSGAAAIEVIASNSGVKGYSGDCGPATLAKLRNPRSMAYVPAHDVSPEMLVVSDSGNGLVRGIELTSWPGCVRDLCSEPVAGQIDGTTGLACGSGSCGFLTGSADECAFRCNHFGEDRFPYSKPTMDIAMTPVDAQNLFLGCPGDSVGSVDAPLLACALNTSLSGAERISRRVEATRPKYLRSFAVRKNFTSAGGQVVPAGSELLGVVMGGSLRRVNSTAAQPSFWMGASVPASFSMRFTNPSSVACASWSWTRLDDGVNGTCYMLDSSTTPSATPCTSGLNICTGSADCRPGRIKNIMGGGSQSISQAAKFLGGSFNPLAVDIGRPSAVLLSNSGSDNEMVRAGLPPLALYVTMSDRDESSLGHLAAVTLAPHMEFETAFWIFIAGPQADTVAANLRGDTDVLQATLQSRFGFENDFVPVDLSTLAINASSSSSTAGDCNPGQSALSGISDIFARTQAGVPSMCEQYVCNANQVAVSRFTTVDCCKAFCEKLYADDCGTGMFLFSAGLSTMQKCRGVLSAHQCINSIINTGIAGCTFDATLPSDLTVLGALIGADPTQLGGNLVTYCQSATVANTIGCNGYCDLGISQVLGLNDTWISLTPVYGILYSTRSFRKEESLQLGERFVALKQAEELAIRSGLGFPGSDPNYTALTAWAPGTDEFRNFMFSLWNFMGFVDPTFTNDTLQVAFSQTNHYSSAIVDAMVTPARHGAGEATWLFGGEAGPEIDQLLHPGGMAEDRAGRLYLADTGNFRILQFDNIWHSRTAKIITGQTGIASYNGNGGLALFAYLTQPTNLVVGTEGVLYVADSASHQIRQVLGQTWNLPCSSSSEYFARLANPTAANVEEMQAMESCRLNQIRATVLHAINSCEQDKTQPMCESETRGDAEIQQLFSQANGTYAQLLIDLCEQPPDCTGCLLANGCNFAEAQLTWNLTGINATNWEPPDCLDGATTDCLVCQKTYLLSDWAAEQALMAMTSLKERIAGTAQEIWGQTALTDSMVSVRDAPDAFLEIRLASLKRSVCADSSANGRARVLFHHWLMQIVNVCVCVLDSDHVDRKAMIGGQLYDRMSMMVTHLFAPTRDFEASTETASDCYSPCNLLHPRFFGNQSYVLDRDVVSRAAQSVLAPLGHRCCGESGYMCGPGEGPCLLDSECTTGLVCQAAACMWDDISSCCVEPGTGAAVLQQFHTLAREIGYLDLELAAPQ